jgi:hypothetical protein
MEEIMFICIMFMSFMFPCAYWLKIIFLNENESKEYNIYTSTPIIHLNSNFLLSFLKFLLLSFYVLKSVLTFIYIKMYSKYSLLFNNPKKKTKAFRLSFSLGKKSFHFPFFFERKEKCHPYATLTQKNI